LEQAVAVAVAVLVPNQAVLQAVAVLLELLLVLLEVTEAVQLEDRAVPFHFQHMVSTLLLQI
jgi:P2-related tail formation protein